MSGGDPPALPHFRSSAAIRPPRVRRATPPCWELRASGGGSGERRSAVGGIRRGCPLTRIAGQRATSPRRVCRWRRIATPFADSPRNEVAVSRPYGGKQQPRRVVPGRPETRGLAPYRHAPPKVNKQKKVWDRARSRGGGWRSLPGHSGNKPEGIAFPSGEGPPSTALASASRPFLAPTETEFRLGNRLPRAYAARAVGRPPGTGGG